jgi:hypothetical protein
MNTEQLQHTLEQHKLWLRGEGGQRADLYRANLREADLSEADLSEADLSEADLSEANGIMAFGPMPTSGRMIYAVRHDSGWMVKAGCFWGTLDKLEAEVKSKHNCPMYFGIIQLLRNTTNQ